MVHYIVWGAGNRGKDVVNILGKDRIVAVVDRNQSMQQSEFRGIPVISPEQYYVGFSRYPIVVTPEGYEEEIACELESKGIYWYFLYKEEFAQAETYAIQAPKEKLLEGYDIHKCQYIYGFSLLGLLLFDYLEENGYNSKVVLQKSKEKKLRGYCENVLELELVNPEIVTGQLHLSMPLEGEEQGSSNCRYDTYFDLIEKDIFKNPEIEKFKDLHKGKRCFIIGTGPSLRISDLETLKENSELCISMNGIYKGFHETEWRPDYYVVADLDATYYGKEDILNMNVANKFVADVAWNFEDGIDGMYKWHLVRRWEKGKLPRFSDDFSKCSYAGRTITYDGGLQLAAYMGFEEIYLLGIDCCNYNEKSTAHFFDELGTARKEETGFLQVDDNLLAYMAAKKYSEEHGFKIYNATRGGKLEVFQRVDFDSLF